jgi:hypothetical protein
MFFDLLAVRRPRLPAGLKLSPEGCLPTVSVLTSFGGLALRSITYTLLSGVSLSLSLSLMTSIESATKAIEFVGSIARLTGGPITEFLSARRATVRDSKNGNGEVFSRRLRAMGIRDRPTAPGSPWQND